MWCCVDEGKESFDNRGVMQIVDYDWWYGHLSIKKHDDWSLWSLAAWLAVALITGIDHALLNECVTDVHKYIA